MITNAILLSTALCLLASPGLVRGDAAKSLYDNAQASTGDFLKTLEKLVNIDSGTGFEPGIHAVEEIVIAQLERLGADIEIHGAKPSAGRNIIATLKGRGAGRVLLMAHSDTVFGRGAAAEGPFRIENTKAFGPGVMDDKGGIALGIYALRMLRNLNFDDFGKITFLINPDEEKGSFGSRDLIKQIAREHDYALVLEFGSPEDKVTSWRKGIGYYRIEVHGKAAHAGAAPEKGCNALLEAAHQVLKLRDLDKPEKQSSVNFTLLSAGVRHNMIPEFARAQADVRVLYPEEYERVENDFKRISAQQLFPCSRIEVIAERGRPPFPPNPKTDALVSQAQAIYREIGLELGVEGSGGGTDGNYAASVGTATLDALGPVGGGAHSPDEYIDIDRIAPRLYLLARLLMDLGSKTGLD